MSVITKVGLSRRRGLRREDRANAPTGLRRALAMLAGASLLVGGPATAASEEELTVLQQTLDNLLTALVQRGVLSQSDARLLVANAQGTAQAQAAEREAQEAAIAEAEKDAVRVTYVPDIIKDEIREDVSADLRAQVLEDVVEHAEENRWGVVDALPRWVSRMQWYGDIRVRAQNDMFDDGNAVNIYRNFQAINNAGGATQAGINGFLNTTEDRFRLRGRLRLGMRAQINKYFEAGFAMATGNVTDILSANQTFQMGDGRWRVLLDEVYMTYASAGTDNLASRFSLTGGRMANPWFGTELVWDPDLRFEGIVGTYRQTFGDGSNVYLRLGGFPIEEIELSEQDKWLAGAQLGANLVMAGDSRFSAGLAYYDFENVVGQRNALDSELLDFTAPANLRRGNTLFDIRNDNDPATNLFALASDFELVNVNFSWEYGGFAPVYVAVGGDYVENIGFDAAQVSARVGRQVEERNVGYELNFTLGHRDIRDWADWRVALAYRHLERDAVLDSLSESNFNLGGTDAEGWVLTGHWGLREDIWLRMRWITANEIDGPPLASDVLQLDLESRF